eukprot:6125941-Prymnesium_polylepis.2
MAGLASRSKYSDWRATWRSSCEGGCRLTRPTQTSSAARPTASTLRHTRCGLTVASDGLALWDAP